VADREIIGRQVGRLRVLVDEGALAALPITSLAEWFSIMIRNT